MASETLESGARAAPDMDKLNAFMGKMGGRTFGVQSLRCVGAVVSVLDARSAGPEVLLSLLPLANPTLYLFFGFSRP